MNTLRPTCKSSALVLTSRFAVDKLVISVIRLDIDPTSGKLSARNFLDWIQENMNCDVIYKNKRPMGFYTLLDYGSESVEKKIHKYSVLPILRQMHRLRMAGNWHWPLTVKGQRYHIYIALVPQISKLDFVSLHRQQFQVSPVWEKCSEWTHCKMTWSDYKVKVTKYMVLVSPSPKQQFVSPCSQMFLTDSV